MKASNYIGVLVRVYLGISFFFSDHGNAQPNEAARFLRFALKNGYSWYQGLLKAVVVPHAATFAKLVVIGEIYIGIALVVGATTRLATALAMFLLLNYMCAKRGSAVGYGHRSIRYRPRAHYFLNRRRPHLRNRQTTGRPVSQVLDFVAKFGSSRISVSCRVVTR